MNARFQCASQLSWRSNDQLGGVDIRRGYFDVMCTERRPQESGWRQRGAAAVELAIMLPFLMALIFGVIEWGLVIYDKSVITNAAREAVRTAVSYHKPAWSESQVREASLNAVQRYLASSPLVSFGVADPPNVTAGYLLQFGLGCDSWPWQVKIDYSYVPTGLLVKFGVMESPLSISASGTLCFQ